MRFKFCSPSFKVTQARLARFMVHFLLIYLSFSFVALCLYPRPYHLASVLSQPSAPGMCNFLFRVTFNYFPDKCQHLSGLPKDGKKESHTYASTDCNHPTVVCVVVLSMDGRLPVGTMFMVTQSGICQS